jgi:AcrR family transcriptional regulator
VGKENQKWFRIGKVESLTGFSRRTVHRYLQMGLLHPPEKNGKDLKGHEKAEKTTAYYYDERHIRKLKQIGKLKRQGLSLSAIQKQISVRIESDFPGKQLDEASRFEKRHKLPQRIQGIKTRHSILKLATQMFKEKGYNGTKINDLIKQLNLGKGSFYFFFKNKKELFLECTPGIFEALFSEGWEKILQEKDPLKRLVLRMQTVQPVRNELSAIIKLSKEVLNEDDPKLRSLGNQIILSIREPIDADLRKCIKEGLLPQLNPKIVSIMVVIIIENFDFILAVEKDFNQYTILVVFSDMAKKLLLFDQ